MMGQQDGQKELFSYQVDLDKRVRADHPLRAIAAQIDFSFVRPEVAQFYGKKGNTSIDPVIILKMIFLLFFDDIASERELMAIIAERLDYLWFLGYGLNDEIPNHSVLSKARRRWGPEVFESFFVRTVMQCVEAGLVDGKKIHVDASLVDANASKDSVLKSSPELIAAVKKAYGAQESKLEDTNTPESYQSVNDRLVSTTDPDAAAVRKGGQPSRPRYHHHRVIDDANAVITAVETTPGSIAENRKLMDLVEQHGQNTQQAAKIVVADHKYGTAENYVACQLRGIQTHLGDVLGKQQDHYDGIFPDTAFAYQAQDNTYRCPASQVMKPRRLHPQKRTWEYHLPKGVCARCELRAQCTRSKTGRTIHRHEHQSLLEQARAQAHSRAALMSRRRRQIIVELSFADATNNHGFKRARWRRLWRQQIQDWLIAGIQNIRILLSRSVLKKAAAAQVLPLPQEGAAVCLILKLLAMLLQPLRFQQR